MNRILSVAVAALVAGPLVGPVALAQSAIETTAPHTVDLKKYVESASSADLFEVKASQLALQRSQDPGVRQFAQRMVSENTDASNKLKMELEKAKIEITPPTTMDTQKQALLDKLMNVEREDFNKLYMTMQVAGLQEAVALHSEFGKSGQDSFRAYARTMSTHAKDNLEHAKRINAQLPVSK